jgi:hypothetical protein
MDIGVKLPPELEQATREMIGNAIKQAIAETKAANSYPEYMNQRLAAKYLGTSPSTLIKWEKADIGFPTIMIEGSKHYKKSSLDQWMNLQQKQ